MAAYPYYSTGFGSGTATPASGSPGFTLTPPPQSGVPNPFGMVPGPIGAPNPSGDLGAQYPNLSGTNSALSGDIFAQLSGNLSPGTLRAMQDYEAGFGARTGMPGSNAVPGSLVYNRGVRDIGTTAEGQVRAGEEAYNRAIPTVSGTQTLTPALQTEIAGTNALNASAPNPTMSQSYARQLFDQYLQQLRGPGGGTTGAGGGRGQNGAPGSGYGPGEEPGGVNSDSFFSYRPASWGAPGSGTGTGSILGPSTGGMGTGLLAPYSPDAYTASGDGSNLIWTGQDWGSMFDDPYGTTTASNSNYDPFEGY